MSYLKDSSPIGLNPKLKTPLKLYGLLRDTVYEHTNEFLEVTIQSIAMNHGF